jgi:hypothetical protein
MNAALVLASIAFLSAILFIASNLSWGASC